MLCKLHFIKYKYIIIIKNPWFKQIKRQIIHLMRLFFFSRRYNQGQPKMAHGTRELTNQTERLKDVPKANLNQKKKNKQTKGR